MAWKVQTCVSEAGASMTSSGGWLRAAAQPIPMEAGLGFVLLCLECRGWPSILGTAWEPGLLFLAALIFH